MILNVDKKTGFKNTNRSIPIIIKDHRGIMFYDGRYLKRPPKQFNLPPGKYEVVSGQFNEMMYPVEFKKLKLPKPNRNWDFPTDFEVIFKPLKDKAQINWDRKIITMDPSFKKLPLPTVFFILFHEYGHARYGGSIEDETSCDMFAHNMMIDKGFNPSQTGLSSITSLSDRQLTRKHFLLDEILRNE